MNLQKDNADIIKQRQLLRLGLNLSDEEYVHFRILARKKSIKLNEAQKKVKLISEKLAESNKKNKIYDDEIFKEILTDLTSNCLTKEV